VTIWAQPVAYATDPAADERQADRQLALAQWIVNDLRGRQEER
jgi:hypothetical protein